MTPRKALEAYLGEPKDYTFDVNDYLGKNKGLINIVGLKHKGVVVAGATLFQLVQKHNSIKLWRWAFMYELSKWCGAYTGTQHKTKSVGANHIEQGAIQIGNARYYCVPAERKTVARRVRNL